MCWFFSLDLFPGVCAVATVWVIFLIPETRGKSPEDMKRHFMGTKEDPVVVVSFKQIADD